MSVASRICQAVAFTGYPCEQVSYDGHAETYFVFNMFSTPDDFADDDAGAEVWFVQLHLFAPFTLDTTALRKQIKAAIRDAGFTAPSMTDASAPKRVEDGTEQHLVFEFECATSCGGEDDV